MARRHSCLFHSQHQEASHTLNPACHIQGYSTAAASGRRRRVPAVPSVLLLLLLMRVRQHLARGKSTRPQQAASIVVTGQQWWWMQLEVPPAAPQCHKMRPTGKRKRVLIQGGTGNTACRAAAEAEAEAAAPAVPTPAAPAAHRPAAATVAEPGLQQVAVVRRGLRGPSWLTGIIHRHWPSTPATQTPLPADEASPPATNHNEWPITASSPSSLKLSSAAGATGAALFPAQPPALSGHRGGAVSEGGYLRLTSSGCHRPTAGACYLRLVVTGCSP